MTETNTALQPLDLSEIKLNPVAIFAPGGMNDLLGRIEAEARALVPDLSTAKGRKAIASHAAKVARSKTYLDGLGKDLTADLKAQTAAVDAERRQMRERLDALRDEIRQPLTEWETAETARIEAIRQRIEALKSPVIGSSTAIQQRIAEIEATPIDESWGAFAADAARAKDAALVQARAALVLAQAEETAERERQAAAEAAERARREAAEREQHEREARIAREAAEQATREAEARAKAEQERAERQRIAAEQRAAEAEQRRQQEAAEAARRQQEAEARARQEAAQAERERIAAEAEEARRQQEDAARLAANREHRAAINREVKAALMASGLSEDDARHVVTAAARGEIPHLSINY